MEGICGQRGYNNVQFLKGVEINILAKDSPLVQTF
jgi:hypothetical protein